MIRSAIVLVTVLVFVGLSQAALIQHLDATVSGSVTGNPVTQWADQSGSNNHAVNNVGNVYYPSASLSASGLAGLDFGTTRNDLQLLNSSGASALLDFSGDASGNSGFSVLVAFKVNQMPGTRQYIIGTRHTLGNVAIRVESDGTLQLQLNNILTASGSAKVAAGDTVVVGMTYQAATGSYQFWDSLNDNTRTGTQTANANYGNGNILRLGEANVLSSSTGYLRGMVGEVKIYNHVLSTEDFMAERNLLAEKWVDISAPVAVNWRVIAPDPAYPTDDVIVAAISLHDRGFNNPLPADPANSDCTATFQEALDLVSNAGGGTVFVPDGQYRISGTLTIASNVILRGRWREITSSAPAAGTILKLYSTGPNANITLTGSGSGVRDLTFWHPNQSAFNPTAYPFVIAGKGGLTTIENITFVNAYNGIDMSSSSMCCLRGIYGSPLKVGLTADKSYAVSRYADIHFSPDYWAWSGLPGSPSLGGAHKTYMRSNGVAINIKEMDGFHLMYSSISGYWKGLLLQDGVSGDNPWGSLAYTTITDCDYAVHLESAKSIPMLHCTFQASEIAIWLQIGSPSLNACTIDSSGYAFYANQNLKLVNCNWTGAVDLGSGTLTNASYAPMPDFNQVYDKLRKPLKTNLFNVKDYGALGDGVTDDTAAVQAAVAAANTNGGGIVFVPDGKYVMTGNLVLAIGVELRGNSGGRHIASAKTGQQLGSLLLIDVGAGNENGTPFITMGDYCGIRGLSFHYPNQVWQEYFIKYPFMIQANGIKNYIIDCSASNPYQAAELNGDDHLVEYTFFGGLRRTYRANNCSGGRIQFCHIKPDFWRDFWLPGNPASNLSLFKWNMTKEGLEVFYLNNCDNYSISSIFNHASHTFFTADNSSGQTLLIGGEQLQRGFVSKNGSKTFDHLGASCNNNSIGDYTGMFGMKTEESFNGQARFYGGGVQGTSDDGWACEGGVLYVQQGSISGPSNRGAMGISCGPNGTMIMEGCSSGEFVGFRNQGTVAMKDGYFYRGFVNSHIARYLANNDISKTFVLCDVNQYPVRNFGLVLNQSNTQMVDALIMGGATPAEQSDDARRVRSVRTTSGSYSLDVTDPDFTDGSKKSVEIFTSWYADTDCTINIYYDSTSGMKLGRSITYTGANDAIWRTLSFSVSDARFGSSQDIRIDISGSSPGLAYVAIVSSQLPPPADPPAAPTGLTAISGISKVNLDWSNSGGGDLASYKVYRSMTPGSYATALAAGVTTSNYIDNTATNGTTYYYVVTAVDTAGNESNTSNEDSALPPDLTDDDKVDLSDLAKLAEDWLTTYGVNDLVEIAEHWLVD